MFSDEFFAAIKADRERDIRNAQRARLARAEPVETEPATTLWPVDRRSATRMAHQVQPSRTSVDPSR